MSQNWQKCYDKSYEIYLIKITKYIIIEIHRDSVLIKVMITKILKPR